MKLVKKDRLAASSCGADVKLSVEGAFRIVEDMVTELMGDQHIDGVTCMREYGGMWVFVRNRIEMPQALAWMDEYTATSYISSFSKIRLYIDTVLQKADGSIALKSRLELCAVDLETGKIRKSESVGVGEKTPAEEPTKKRFEDNLSCSENSCNCKADTFATCAYKADVEGDIFSLVVLPI